MSLFDYEALCSALEQLWRSFGVLPRVLGRTVLGRAVFALELGAGRRRSLLVCGQSGDEGTLCAQVLRFCESLLAAAREGALFCGVDARRALRESGVTVVPCLNPDGLELQTHGVSAAGPLRRFLRPLWQPDTPWKANAAGVDLRRQYPAGFFEARDRSLTQGFSAPGPGGYVGTLPCSEAEGRALCGLCRRERFCHALLVQKGDPALLWRAGESDRAKALLGAKLLSQEGNLPLLPDGDDDGTFARWFAETAGRPVFTAQTGNGNVPLPEADLVSLLTLAVLL